MAVIGTTFAVKTSDDVLVYTVTIDDTILPEGIGLSCLTGAQMAEVEKTGKFPSSVTPVLIPINLWPSINSYVENYRIKNSVLHKNGKGENHG